MNTPVPDTRPLAPVIDLLNYRKGDQRAKLRRELTVSFKNPILLFSPLRLKAMKLRLAADLLDFPNDIAAQIRWELMKEVENG
jgi:hypothetical protein